MPVFSEASKAQLATLHPDLKTLLNVAIRFVDFKVLEGHRTKTRQNRLFDEGKSKLRWPNSNHNSVPSRAVDVAPWPLDWSNSEEFVLLAGYILRIADELDIPIRWGGDWDSDYDTDDETFRDYGHFELDE